MPTRPAISWSDLAGARVGVFGLGIEGTANLRKLVALGADVVVVEDTPPPGDALGHEVLALAAGGLEALLGRDVIVKAPGVRRRRPEMEACRELGIPIVGGLGLWLEEVPREKVLAITGTKGKSTTTALAGHLLEGLGHRALVAGNIGNPPYDEGSPADFEYAVVEVSSYQATDVASSPEVVAVTSLHPDHLDWHGGVEQYFEDKLSLTSQPGARLTIADGASELLRARRHLLGPEVAWVTAGAADTDGGPDWVRALGLVGAHNRRNALIARASLQALGVEAASDDDALVAAGVGFEGLPSRLRVLGRVRGVTFVDDSLSTNVLPALAALESFPGQPVALIAGGHDRGIDYEPLAEGLSRRSHDSIALFTVPENGPRIRAAITSVLGAAAPFAVDCQDLDEAVERAFAWAVSRPDGVVLLSPAAPSFGHFANYKARAAAFAAAMERCAGAG